MGRSCRPPSGLLKSVASCMSPPGERREGQTDTPPSAYPSCPLYDARHRNRTMGGGGRHHRGCYDRSPWACRTPAQIWLDEENRRPVQSSDAPGTGRHRHTGARVTMGADHGERPWWKRSGSRRWSPLEQQPGMAPWVTRGPRAHG